MEEIQFLVIGLPFVLMLVTLGKVVIVVPSLVRGLLGRKDKRNPLCTSFGVGKLDDHWLKGRRRTA